ncbi:MAG: right-handed parallel beta-helix repeat-containing protein [Deltaproteobacteria bacterium]|nr:right-handed parallel beta-helix repeat-containing protein [Deltaproteobacteria bacterium]MBW2535245.1 right-handed parallel beta-helix repeat-containing protein [Deltaproteobacteria bacterium]
MVRSRPALGLVVALVLVGCLVGCSDEPALVPTGSGGGVDGGGAGGGGGGSDDCPAPGRWVGERCLEPGVQDDGCPAGQLGLEDGSCRPAGVTPELCADGFVHDGDVGCAPVLPAEPCPTGQMAVPGESSCQPVMECGSGQWGNIPVDEATVYVDGAYGGGASDGSVAQPFTTIGAALAAASAGALIAVAAGSYHEDVLIETPVRLWGVCPADVSIEGAGNTTGAIDIRAGASGSEVVGVAVTTSGNPTTVSVSGAEDVTLERLWIHDSLVRGVHVQDELGPTSLTLRRVLIEQCRDFGVLVLGSQASLEGVVVRGTQPRASDLTEGWGVSIMASPSTGAPSTATIAGSLVDRNHEIGVLVAGSQADLEAVVVRSTLPRGSDQTHGRGINVQSTDVPSAVTVVGSLIEESHDAGVFVVGSEARLEGVVVRDTRAELSDQTGGAGISIQRDPSTAATSTVTVAGSLIEQSHEFGIYVSGTEVSLEGVVVRDTSPTVGDQNAGRGINIQPQLSTGAPATATVTGSLVDRSHEAGVFVGGGQARLAGLVVRDTQPRESDQGGGVGIAIQPHPSTGAPATAMVTGSLVDRSHEVGVLVAGTEASLAGLVVRDTLPQATDQRQGRGIGIQPDPSTGAPATVFVTGSLVAHNHDFGVFIAGSQASLEGVVVRATAANAADGYFGDGIAVVSEVGPSSCSVSGCRSEENARAGLSNFGGDVSLEGSQLWCNQVDMAGDPYSEQSFYFEDLGRNSCGCGATTGMCIAATAGLTPPPPLDGAL